MARQAQVDHSNLTRWLSGEPTLSAEKVEKVLDAVGLPGGVPCRTKVHEWKIGGGWENLEPAFRLYFPNQATLFFAPWTAAAPWGEKEDILETAKAASRLLPEIYAMTDGEVRAVLRCPFGVYAALEDTIGSIFKLSRPRKRESVIPISAKDELWLRGPLSIAEFDRLCHIEKKATEMDVILAINRIGMSYEQAIDHLLKISYE